MEVSARAAETIKKGDAIEYRQYPRHGETPTTAPGGYAAMSKDGIWCAGAGNGVYVCFYKRIEGTTQYELKSQPSVQPAVAGTAFAMNYDATFCVVLCTGDVYLYYRNGDSWTKAANYTNTKYTNHIILSYDWPSYSYYRLEISNDGSKIVAVGIRYESSSDYAINAFYVNTSAKTWSLVYASPERSYNGYDNANAMCSNFTDDGMYIVFSGDRNNSSYGKVNLTPTVHTVHSGGISSRSNFPQDMGSMTCRFSGDGHYYFAGTTCYEINTNSGSFSYTEKCKLPINESQIRYMSSNGHLIYATSGIYEYDDTVGNWVSTGTSAGSISGVSSNGMWDGSIMLGGGITIFDMEPVLTKLRSTESTTYYYAGVQPYNVYGFGIAAEDIERGSTGKALLFKGLADIINGAVVQ